MLSFVFFRVIKSKLKTTTTAYPNTFSSVSKLKDYRKLEVPLKNYSGLSYSVVFHDFNL